MKKIIKKMFIGTGIFLGLLLILLIGIRSYLGTDQAQHLIQARLNRDNPGQISWENFNFSLLAGRFELKNALLKGPEQEKLASVDRIFINLSLPALLKGDVNIENISIEKPQIWLHEDAEGSLNIMKAFPQSGEKKEKPPSEGKIPSIKAGEITLTDAFFQYKKSGKTPGEKDEQIIIHDLDLKVEDGNLAERSAIITLDIGRGDIDTKQIKTSLESLGFKAVLDKGRLEPVSLNLDSNMAGIKLSGNADPLISEPVFDIDLDVETSLEEIRESIGLSPELSGKTAIKLKAKGSAGNPEAELVLNYGGGNLAGNQVDKIALDCRMKDRLLNIKNLILETGLGNIALAGDVNFQKAFANGFLSSEKNMEALSYNLSLKQDDTLLEKIPGQEKKLSGRVKSTVNLEGTGINPETLTAKAVLEIFTEKLGVKGVLEPVNAHLTAQAGLERNRLNIESLNLDTGKTALDIKGDYGLKSREMNVKILLNAPDLPEILSAFGVKDIYGGLSLDADVSGTPAQPVTNISLKGKKFAFQDIVIGNIDINAGLNKSGMVNISDLSLENQGSAIKAKGKIQVFEKETALHPDLPSDISLTFKNLESKDFLKKELFAGTVSGNLDLKGKLMNPKAKLTLEGKNLKFEKNRIGDLDTGIRFADGTVFIDNLKLVNGKSSLNLSGTAEVLDRNMKALENPELNLKLDNTSLFAEDFSDEFNGNVNLSARIKGKVKSPEASVSLHAKGLAAQGKRIGDLDAELEFADGQVNIDSLKLRNRKSDISLSGTARILASKTMQPLKDPEFSLNLDKGTIYPQDFEDSLKGKLQLKAKASGSLNAPVADISIKGNDLAAGKNRIGDLNAGLRFDKGMLFIDHLKLRNGKSGLDISGSSKILNPQSREPLKDPEFNLKIDGDKIFLEDFAKDIKGRLAVNGHVQGSVSHPKGSLSLNGKNIDLRVQKIDGVKLSSSLDGERVNIDSLLIAMAPGEEIAADGWLYPVKKNYDLRIKSKGVSFKNIDMLRDKKLGDGKISLNIEGKGSFEDPQAKGDVNVKGLRINQKLLDDLNIHIDVKDHVADISGKLNFDLDGKFHLQKKDFSARIRFDNTDLAPFFKIGGKENMGGTLTGIIEAEGNADAPDKLQVLADIAGLSVFMDKTELIQAGNFKASLKNGNISIPGIKLTLLNQGYINIKGQGKLDGPVDLNAEGSIPFKVIQPFVEDIQNAKGNIGLSASLRGSFSKPDIKADITLNKIGMIVPGLMQELANLNGRISLNPGSLTLKDINGNLDAGSFTLSGNASLKNFQPVGISVKFKAHALPVNVPDTVDILLNTDISISGTQDKSLISGEITLLEGRYYKDIKLNLLEMGRKTRKESAPPSEASNPFLKNMALNIKIIPREPFIVDNNIILMSLKPDLRIYGSLSSPLIGGRAEAESGGTITYQKKDFEIEKGVIDFLNPYKIEPTLDIRSKIGVRTWIVYLDISGTPDNLKFKFTSEPHEEDGDILSLLTLGKTTKELIKGEGGTPASTKQMLANIVTDTLGKDLKDATGLDIIELKYKENENAGSQDDIQITVGKELSRRLTVKYGVETKDGVSVQKAITEYRFLENLIMSAFQDTEGDFGGELVFRLEFR